MQWPGSFENKVFSIFFFICNCEGLWDLLTLQKIYTGSFKPSDKSFAFKIIDHLLKKSQLSCNCPLKRWTTIWLYLQFSVMQQLTIWSLLTCTECKWLLPHCNDLFQYFLYSGRIKLCQSSFKEELPLDFCICSYMIR